MSVAFITSRPGPPDAGFVIFIVVFLAYEIAILYAFDKLIRKGFIATMENIRLNERHEYQLLQQQFEIERAQHQQKLREQQTESFTEMVAMIAHGTYLLSAHISH